MMLTVMRVKMMVVIVTSNDESKDNEDNTMLKTARITMTKTGPMLVQC